MKEERRKKIPKKISSVSHPTRQAILEELKGKEQTTLDLEQSLVYNLRKNVAPIVLEINKLSKDKQNEFKLLLNKILSLWKKDQIKNVNDIDEVLIIPSIDDE